MHSTLSQHSQGLRKFISCQKIQLNLDENEASVTFKMISSWVTC